MKKKIYLNYLKENYKDYWALCIDADEVVQDLDKLKAFIQEAVTDYVYALPIRHLMGSLAHEDATQQNHIALGRLFKVDDCLYSLVIPAASRSGMHSLFN